MLVLDHFKQLTDSRVLIQPGDAEGHIDRGEPKQSL